MADTLSAIFFPIFQDMPGLQPIADFLMINLMFCLRANTEIILLLAALC